MIRLAKDVSIKSSFLDCNSSPKDLYSITFGKLSNYINYLDKEIKRNSINK